MTQIIKFKATPFDTNVAAAKAAVNALNPAATRAAAAAAANAQIGQAVKGSNIDFTSSQQQLLDAQTRAQEFAKARASQEAAAGQMAFGQYDQAAKTLGSLGGALVGSAAHDWDTASQQAQQQVEQMTGGRVTNLPTQYATPELRNAAATLGVALPGSSLIDQAKLASAQARGDVVAGARNAESIGANYGSQMTDAVAQHVRDLAGIRAKRPELFQAALAATQGRADRAVATLNALTGQQAGYLTTQENQRQANLNRIATNKARFEALHHQDYDTGQPLAGWTYDPEDKTGRRLITTQEFAYNRRNDRDYDEKVREWNKTFGETVRSNKENEAAARARADAQSMPGYDEKLSKQRGVLMWDDNTPMKDANGHTIPWSPDQAKPPKQPSVEEQSKHMKGMITDLKKWRDGEYKRDSQGKIVMDGKEQVIVQQALSPLAAFRRLIASGELDGPYAERAMRAYMDVFRGVKPFKIVNGKTLEGQGPTMQQVLDNFQHKRPLDYVPPAPIDYSDFPKGGGDLTPDLPDYAGLDDTSPSGLKAQGFNDALDLPAISKRKRR